MRRTNLALLALLVSAVAGCKTQPDTEENVCQTLSSELLDVGTCDELLTEDTDLHALAACARETLGLESSQSCREETAACYADLSECQTEHHNECKECVIANNGNDGPCAELCKDSYEFCHDLESECETLKEECRSVAHENSVVYKVGEQALCDSGFTTFCDETRVCE